MLVLARKPGEAIHVGDDVVITVVQIRPGRVRLGIEAPSRIAIRRQEVAGRRPEFTVPSEASAEWLLARGV